MESEEEKVEKKIPLPTETYIDYVSNGTDFRHMEEVDRTKVKDPYGFADADSEELLNNEE